MKLLFLAVALIVSVSATCTSFLDCTTCFQSEENCVWCSKGPVGCYGSLGDIPDTCTAIQGWSDSVVEGDASTSFFSPDENTVSLRPRGSVSLPFTVSLPPLVPQIFHLQDLSASFDGDLSYIREGLPLVLTWLQGNFTDGSSTCSMAVSAFIEQPYYVEDGSGVRNFVPNYYSTKSSTVSDSTGAFGISETSSSSKTNYVYKPISDFTTSPTSLETTLNSVKTNGNSDTPEAALSAMYHSLKVASGQWDDDAIRLFTLATDAPFHIAEDYIYKGRIGPTTLVSHDRNGVDTEMRLSQSSHPPSFFELGSALEAADVVPIFMVAGTDNNQLLWYEELVEFLGVGFVLELDDDSENLASDMVSIASSLQGTLDISFSSSNPHFTVTGSLDSTTRSESGNPGSFNVTVLPSIFTASDSIPLYTDITISVVGTSYSKVYRVNTFNGCDCDADDVELCDDGSSPDRNDACGVCPCPDYISPACICYLEGASPCSATNTDYVDCDICVCNEGWTGDDCTCSTVCPAVVPSDDSEISYCNGHGSCNCGVCNCEEGYHGDECLCEVGFGGTSGEDCSCSTAECPDDCRGHGECVCGECECDTNWEGDSCDADSFSCSDLTSCDVCSAVALCGWCHDGNLDSDSSSCVRLSSKGGVDDSVCRTEAPELASATCILEVSSSNILAIVSGSVGAAGIGAAVLAKFLIKRAEKKEWDEFKKTGGSDKIQNPIYEKQFHEEYNKMEN